MRPPEIFESVLLAEMNLGLPPTFFYSLLKEPDDWAFILKLSCVKVERHHQGRLARRWRAETTMILAWMAERLGTGSWTSVANLLRKQKEQEVRNNT
jgi:hypothetical protein